FSSFPFNRKVQHDVDIEAFNKFFKPGGTVAQFLQQKNIAELFVDNGTELLANNGAKLRSTRAFVAFINSANSVTKAFFANNGSQPKLSYYVRPFKSNNSGEFTLDIDGKAHLTESESQAQELAWTGEPGNVRLAPRTADAIVDTGPWAVFHFLSRANKISDA